MKICLDVHAHLIPLGADHAGDGDGLEWDPAGFVIVDGSALRKRELYDPALLVAWMDRNAVAQAWVSPPPTLYRAGLEAEQALAWARKLNTALHARVKGFDRLRAMAHLPVQHPSAAIQAAEEAIARGQRLFTMPAGDARRGRMLSDDAYAPLWSVLNDAGAFLMLHPAGACDPRLSRFSLPNLLGGPTETAIAAAHLAMSGVLERHPGITFCLAHGGGATAAVAGRLARGQDTGREGAYLGGEKVRAALRRFCVDCITHDPASLELVASVFGEERVLFGSDWPFDMGLDRPHEDLAGVSAPLREKLMSSNANALLERLELPGPPHTP
jgi:aminocarboxymuconate-semialdehyde decarboxylase